MNGVVIVGNRECVQDGIFVRCPGCARWFMGVRGIRAHQSRRFTAMDCKAFPDAPHNGGRQVIQ